MPGAADTLSTLEARGIATGVVSNAQFYSPLAIQALMGRPLPEPAVWSFGLGEAKPSPRLFRIALDDLAGRGIRPGEVLCIGNDMAKDILPAAALGCRTALFAGDQRSYRPGTWQAPVVPPDAVLTDLRQITTDLLTE
jgi:putative hydrolase of the HAD superfamily